MCRLTPIVLAAVLTLTGVPAVAAQSVAPPTLARPVLITDRPDFTESSDVVPARWLQFESGVTVQYDGPGALRTRSVRAPAGLFRLGLGMRTELRVGGGGYVIEREATSRTNGFSDLTVGTKVRLLHESEAGLDMAIISMVSLPTGAAGLSSEGVDPTLKVTWGRGLPGAFSLAGNVNVAWITEQGSYFAQQAVSISVSRDLGRGWSGFAELYGFTKMTRASGSGITFDGGVCRVFGNILQIDLEAGRGLTDEAPDWFAGAGLAVLLPAWKR